MDQSKLGPPRSELNKPGILTDTTGTDIQDLVLVRALKKRLEETGGGQGAGDLRRKGVHMLGTVSASIL